MAFLFVFIKDSDEDVKVPASALFELLMDSNFLNIDRPKFMTGFLHFKAIKDLLNNYHLKKKLYLLI